MKWIRNRLAVKWIMVMAMAVLPAASACAGTADALAGRVDALVQDYVRNALFTGVVLVARDGKPVFRKGFGAANREWAVANTPDTRFRIGSITKQFTAAAVMRLVDEHKLALDDTIGQHIKDLPASWQAVTIRQLLQHSSGIPRYTALDDFDDTLVRVKRTPRQIVDLVKALPLEFAPGSQFRYNNTGYVLLGMVVEAASGLAYRDFLEQKLLQPLGLKHAGYDDGRRILPHAAQSYVDGADEVRQAGFADMSNVYAAGAMVSTADDLLAWQQMLVNGKVLGRESTAATFSDGGHRYGLGWYVKERFSKKVYEHGGSLQGFQSVLAYYPADKLTVIVLGNYGDQDVVEFIADGLARLALGVAPKHQETRVDPGVFSRLVGRYALAPDAILTVSRKDGRLFAQLTGQRQLEIYPEDAYRYFYKAVDAQLVFDASGPERAGYLVLRQEGREMKAPRID